MEVAVRKLREKSGEIALRLSLTLLVAVLLFLVVINIRHAYQVIDQVMDRTNEAVLAVAAVNGPRALSGVREADGLVRNYDGANWNRVVTTNEVLYALGISLGAYADGPQSLIRDGSYRIDHLVTSYVNSDGGVLHFVTTMDLTISLLGGDSLTVTRPLEVRTTYEAKF